jgi:hypothetical protein
MKKGPYLVTSTPVSRSRLFNTGEPIEESGIYRVHHMAHRLPHEVSLFSGQSFPRCEKCRDAVTFELLHAAPAGSDALGADAFRVYLYELPVLSEGGDESVAS